MAHIRKAANHGIAGRRILVGLITAALLAGTIACAGDSGVVAVGLSDEGLIAITYASSGGLAWGRLPENYGYGFAYSSQDGGLTWSQRDTPGELPAEWQQQDVWLARNYRQNAVNTPRGYYRIDGSDIQIHTPDGEQQTVYSAAHLQTPFNQWLQAKSIEQIGYALDPSSGPVSITYDPPSGNLIAAMGILGVVVGTPNGNWTSAGVGPYYPIDFSGPTRIGALLSSISLWAAALAFPLATIAVVFTVVSLARMFPVYAWAGGYFNTTSQSYLSVPMAILSMLLAAFSLATVGNVEIDNLGDSFGNYIKWFCLLVSAIFSLVSVAGSLDSLAYSTNGKWRFSRRMLAITAGALAAMMVFVLLSHLAWAQWGNDLRFGGLTSIILCAVVAVGLICYYWRTARKVTPHLN